MTNKPADLDPHQLLAEAAKQQQAKAGGKGSVRKALAPEIEFLRAALRLELTLTTIRDLLGQRGISVSLSGLRAYLLEFLRDEYTAYLNATGRGYRSTRTGVSLAKPPKNAPKKLAGASTHAETDKPKKETPSTIENKESETESERDFLLDAAQPRKFNVKPNKQ